jgi:hypothetical protein
MSNIGALPPQWLVIIPALSGLIGAAIGSMITHVLTKRRDRDQKRRELALK